MVETFDEKKDLEEIKQKNKLDLIDANSKASAEEHKQKMERLDKMHLMVKDGWKYAERNI